MPVILGIEVVNSTPLGDMRKEFRRVQKQVMHDTATEFAEKHVAPHFGPQNRSRFQHEKRNNVYAQKIKKEAGEGQGKYVDNVLTGRSRRQALSTVKVTATQDSATVRFSVPAYFARPFVGTFEKSVRNKDGSTRRILKRVTRQPDKAKEVGQVDQLDRERLTKFAVRRGTKLWQQAKAARRKKL